MDQRAGPSLAAAIIKAAKERERHRKLHAEFTLTFPSKLVSEWREMLANWQRDPINSPDPFMESEEGM